MTEPRPPRGLVMDRLAESGFRRRVSDREGPRTHLNENVMLWPPEVEMEIARRSARSVGAPTLVLLVDDSPGDVRLIREAFHDVNQDVYLHVAPDGVEAMEFLKREGPHVHAPRPDLILLDLNLPRMDGREVLANLNRDDALQTIPTCILTTSKAEDDVMRSYQLRANAYLSKPVELEAFESLVRTINEFWLTKVSLPHTRAA
jgi:chemotaxis family two-component system response regulator Rcp1